MEFIYTTALEKIRSMTKRIKVIPGGSSAGKTFSIIPIIIDMCCKESNLSASIVSESFPHLRKGAMRDFLNIMKSTNRYIDTHWNRTNSIYTFSNGSYIEFFSADSADKLRGARRNVLYVNECNNITRDAYTQLAMRSDGDIFLDYNPSHSFWVNDILKEAETEKLVLTYKDNEALSQNVIDFLESKRVLAKTSEYWENWCRVYLDGEEGRLEGTIFNDWEVLDIIPDEASVIGYGLDFGYTNDPTTLICAYKYNDTIIFDEVIYETGLTNQNISNRMKGIRDEIFADSAEPKSIREIKNYGFRIQPTTKGKDSINYGIQLIQERKVFVTKRSYHLIEELERYMWKSNLRPRSNSSV